MMIMTSEVTRREPAPKQADERTPQDTTTATQPPMPKEIGGPKGPEPTRYGDWERNGRCSDF
ncbi:DUF1674 domain-containing protein [Alkalilimnicola ehrlichii]|nr:succinate dehydrogenase assembly factor 4 [Alkalilimnicola ehrlichii]